MTRAQKWLWMRPLLLLGALVMTPLPWTETRYTGCSGEASGPVTIQVGWELMADVGEMIGGLTAVAILLIVATGVRRFALRIAVHTLSLLVHAALLMIVHFAATFVLFASRKLEMPAWAAMVALGGCVADSMVRLVIDIWDRVRRRMALDPNTG